MSVNDIATQLEALPMRVFLTGASGFVGSAIVPELIGAGHEVVGLARSDASAAAIAAAGAEVHRGSLDDTDSLRTGAAGADGVIHTAFIHDFSDMPAAGRTDLRAVETLGAALAGSGRPLVVTSGTAMLAPGRLATEEDRANPEGPAAHRTPSDRAALAFADRGVRSSLVRLPPTVHGPGDHGFVAMVIDAARRTGVSAYVGDGTNRWAAVHRLDAARVFRLALERGAAGSVFHAVGEEGVPLRDVAEVIARHIDVPLRSISVPEATGQFGFLGAILALDTPASSALTRELLGWRPERPGLLDDLEHGDYFEGANSGTRDAETLRSRR
jgi:nucleoside-diphosphate-sugar epimerase